ncbi:MAG: hypothetical protein ACKV0T_20490 [Planctomycetales bacterium]
MRITTLGYTLAAALLWGAVPAQAQILIWNLPQEDGAWVKFEGAYTQTQARPESNAGDEVLKWRSELTITSVGQTQATFQGAEVPCRWVEFKSVTRVEALEKPPGPGGTYLYKVLIPESKVIGKPVDDTGIPVTFLPIVKGYRKVSQRDVEPVSDRVLAVYPTIALLTYYPDLQADESQGGELPLKVSNDPVPVRVFKGSRLLQDKMSRSKNSGVLWLTDTLPFGLARYQVSVTREERGLTSQANEFRRTSLIEVDMSAVASGNDGRSELPDNN